jgi:uracil DNA glycosylase
MIVAFKDIFNQVDGKDHINVFSRGKTTLGQLLSNFAHTPFTHEGKVFESVEGYWFYKVSGDEHFLSLYGSKAKEKGKQVISRQAQPTPDELMNVYRAKLRNNPHLEKLLIKSTLPFAHYYQYGGPPMSADKYLWTVQLWDDLRTELKLMKRLKEIIGEGWYTQLQPFFESTDFKNIIQELKNLKDKGYTIVPKFDDVFSTLKNCPFEDVKVVLILKIGLDVEQNDKITEAIAKAIYKDVGKSTTNIWKTADVLLLPLNLTTCDKQDHNTLWKPFIVAIMKALQSKKGTLYGFIGKEAYEYVNMIDPITDDFYVAEHPMQAIANNRPWNHKELFAKIDNASQFINNKQLFK